MVKRIDILLHTNSQYNVLTHFTLKFHEALLRAGINSNLYHPDKLEAFISSLNTNRPDFTLTMNGIFPLPNGKFISEFTGIPHINYLTDLPHHFSFLVKSPANIITCMDREAADFLEKIHPGFTFFLGHGVERDLNFSKFEERPYDVVVLGSCIDYESFIEYWKKKYPEPLFEAIMEAAEVTLSTQDISFWQALIRSVDRLAKTKVLGNLSSFDFITVLRELEMYIRGYDRARLIKSVKDAKVHIFGKSKELWEKTLGNPPNCIFHDEVPFEEAINIMKKSKIILHSCIAIKAGGHERIYTGLACGGLVVAGQNSYLEETFKDGENIVFYTTKGLSQINNKINELLADENRRANIAESGREVVMKHHTWDHRADELLKALNRRP